VKKIFNPRTGRSYPVRKHSSKHHDDGSCVATACHLNIAGGICEASAYIDGFSPAECGKILLDCVSDDGEHIGLPEEVINEWAVDE